jgi:hypothetical protein
LANTSSTRCLLPAAAIIIASAAGLAACTTGTEATPSADLGHVHGLGVDPSNGETYAATHNGVWLVPTGKLPSSFPANEPDSSGAPLQIADRAQDTMGFTVARPGLLLASGHPDPADTDSPANLGLIASTNRANTWEPVSLSGEADFHDLEVVDLPDGQLRVYGYDNGTIKVSDDNGQTLPARTGCTPQLNRVWSSATTAACHSSSSTTHPHCSWSPSLPTKAPSSASTQMAPSGPEKATAGPSTAPPSGYPKRSRSSAVTALPGCSSPTNAASSRRTTSVRPPPPT